MAVFRGMQRQRGHGLGNVIKTLGRMVIPLLAKHLGSLKKEAVHSGVELAGDLVRGENPKKAFKSAVKKTLKGTINRIQTGGQKKRRGGLMGRWVRKIKKNTHGPPGKADSGRYKRKRKTQKKLSSSKSRQQRGSRRRRRSAAAAAAAAARWGILQ